MRATSWTVKNVKSWIGHEGIGTVCTLFREGRQVATCRDDGDGAEMDIIWSDRKVARVDINIMVLDHDAPDGNRIEKAHTYKGTPEEKLLAEYANAITEDCYGMTLRKDCGWIVSDLCDLFDKEKGKD